MSNFLPPYTNNDNNNNNKKQKAFSPSLLIPRQESFLGSCPILFFACLEKSFSFVQRGKSGERFCFIRFDSIFTKDNRIRLSSQLERTELVSWSGGDSGGLCPVRSAPLGDDQGLLPALL